MISKIALMTKRPAQTNIIRATTLCPPLSLNSEAPFIKPLDKKEHNSFPLQFVGKTYQGLLFSGHI
jgi:hypothetical protein